MICDIVVPVQSESNRPAWPAELYAISLAAIFGAHLTAIGPSFVQPVSGMLRAEIPAELIEEAERQADTAAQTAISSFEERAAHAGVLHQSVVQRGGPAEFADAFTTRARAFDLAVVPQPEGDGLWERELVEAVLFGSGRPALIVPTSTRARHGSSKCWSLGTAAKRRLEQCTTPCCSSAGPKPSRS